MFRKYPFQIIIFGGKILNNFQYFRVLDNDFQSKNNDFVLARLLRTGRFAICRNIKKQPDCKSGCSKRIPLYEDEMSVLFRVRISTSVWTP